MWYLSPPWTTEAARPPVARIPAAVSDSRALRSFLGLAGGEAVARAVAFAATLLIARRLGPEMYGVIGVASGIMLYLTQVADGGIELSGVPFVARQRDALTQLVSAVLTVRLLVALVLTGIVVITGLAIIPQPDGAILALYSLGLVFVAAGVRWVFVGLQHTNWVGGARVAGELTALVIVVVALNDVGDIAVVPIAALVGAGTAATLMLIGLRQLGVRPFPRFAWATSRPLFERAPWLVGFTLLGLVLFNADLIYLRFVSGEAAAGYYAAAYTLIAFAANISITWAHSVMPSIAAYDGDHHRRNEVYETAMLLAFAVALPVAIGGILTATPLIELIFGPRYLAAVPALGWLLVAVPVGAVREIAVVALISAPGGERKLIRINATCAAFNVALLRPVVARYGLIGAAVVTLLTEILRLGIAFRYAAVEGFRLPGVGRFVRPTLAGAAMIPVLLVIRDQPFPVLLVAGASVYAILLIATGVLQFRRPFQVRLVV